MQLKCTFEHDLRTRDRHLDVTLPVLDDQLSEFKTALFLECDDSGGSSATSEADRLVMKGVGHSFPDEVLVGNRSLTDLVRQETLEKAAKFQLMYPVGNQPFIFWEWSLGLLTIIVSTPSIVPRHDKELGYSPALTW